FERDGKKFLRKTAESGVMLEWAVDRPPDVAELAPNLRATGRVMARYQSGPITVLDPTGGVRGWITDLPENVVIMNLDLDADHLLLRFRRGTGNGAGGRGSGPVGLEWRRYELLPKLKEVENGRSMIILNPRRGQNYLIDYPVTGSFGGEAIDGGGFGGPGFGRGRATAGLPVAAYFTIRDARTGAVPVRVEGPGPPPRPRPL